MRILSAETITKTVSELCVRAVTDIPEDVVKALQSARERETGAARAVLDQILENQHIAREIKRPCCQDTGMTVVFLDIGFDAHVEGNVYEAVNEGIRCAYRDAYLRKSVLDPLTRVNTGDNTPGVIHISFVPGDRVTVTVAPKGFGSENMSRVVMLKPAQGREGIINTIVETVRLAGANTCPPGVIGVGIGGTMEQAALLAKRQLLRPIGVPSHDKDCAALEREALALVNATGIGPMGLGGNTTALAVHIGKTATHIAGLPVAVNTQCHAARHASATL